MKIWDSVYLFIIINFPEAFQKLCMHRAPFQTKLFIKVRCQIFVAKWTPFLCPLKDPTSCFTGFVTGCKPVLLFNKSVTKKFLSGSSLREVISMSFGNLQLEVTSLIDFYLRGIYRYTLLNLQFYIYKKVNKWFPSWSELMGH